LINTPPSRSSTIALEGEDRRGFEALARIALDDFGTRRSSRAALRRYPVDVLKLDRSSIASIHCDGQAAAVAMARALGHVAVAEGIERPEQAAVVAMARALGHVAVAEGIERPEQAAALRALGCELGQGYHFSRPVSADDAAQLLRAHAAA
jgi:EAL domain-containing protein (putative c-di-GMP-specific phosphodiesterase class I)